MSVVCGPRSQLQLREAEPYLRLDDMQSHRM